MIKKCILLLGMFLSCTVVADEDVATIFRNSTNLWVKGDLQGFLNAVPDGRVLSRNVPEQEIIQWYLNFLEMESPTNSPGVAVWNRRSPGSDWMCVRAEISRRVGCRMMAMDVDFQRAVAREYRRVKLARPTMPDDPYPRAVHSNGMMNVSCSFEEMVKSGQERTFLRDLQLEYDRYLRVLAEKFVLSARQNRSVDKNRRKAIISELADIAGFTDKERANWNIE